MISQIEIRNFKSLKKADVEVDSLNLLMGLNGMGKSSFLQVLLLLMQSDKLEESIVELNGLLTQIGQGKDALYQYADEKNIEFKFIFDEQAEFVWDFTSQSDKEILTAEMRYAKEQMQSFREKTKQFQYISAERIGPRKSYEASNTVVADKKQLGLAGEYAAYYVHLFGLADMVPETLKHPQDSSNKLIAQVDAWMQEISPGVSINTKYVPEVNKVILDFQYALTTEKTNHFAPKNVGFGISYVLPVVLALLTAEEGKIIVIESPESHIHPKGQAALGKLIALAANVGAQLFIETHSEHILNGIRVAVKEGLIPKSKVNVMYFEKITTDKEQYTKINQIMVDQNGSLSDYPQDFMDEWSNQLSKLI